MLPQRIEEKIEYDTNGGCWLWNAGVSGSNGSYGQTSEGKARHKVPAHVLVWEKTHGPIPAGLEFDHLCRVRLCVNPDHLEPVTHAENVRRGLSGPKSVCSRGHEKEPGRGCKKCAATRARQARAAKRKPKVARTVCANGHAWTPDNIGTKRGGGFYCRPCLVESTRKWRRSRAVPA